MTSSFRFCGIDTSIAEALRNGGRDANGQKAERTVSNGAGNPCRHCLTMIDTGDPMLVFALRPFCGVNPYTETGPAFLHADECPAYENHDGAHLPPVLTDSPSYIMRGYGNDERIVYGTGSVVAQHSILDRAHQLFSNDDVAFIDVRSASNNCWQARLRRDDRETI